MLKKLLKSFALWLFKATWEDEIDKAMSVYVESLGCNGNVKTDYDGTFDYAYGAGVIRALMILNVDKELGL